MTRVISHIIVVHSEQSDVGEEVGAGLLVAKSPNAICATVGNAVGSIVGFVVGMGVGALVGAGTATLAVHTSQQISFPARQHPLKGDPSHSSSRLVGGGEGAGDVGSDVGLSVGALVGTSVGLSVGAAVGLGVGASVGKVAP